MILPNVGLGRLATIEKARGGSRRKEKSHRCGECGHFTLAYGRPLRTWFREAMHGHGHTNCSPERPKQNFLPTLTS